MEKLDPNHIENILALTPVQEGMLFHYLQAPQGELYFEQLSLEVSGKIDTAHFQKAWDIVIETNDMLRTVFRWEKLEKPSQIILKEHKCKVTFYDFSDKNYTQKKSELEEIKKKDRSEMFDLRQVPFRVILCKLEEKKHVIIISNHHILYDGWSNGIILKEFFKAYHDLCKNLQVVKLPAKPPFKEFISWLQTLDKDKQEKFWREYLADFETPTELPIKRRIQDTTRSGDYSIILGGIIKAKLDNFAKNNRATLASIFYTAWGILLQKYCDTEDIIFGTTVSGRYCGVKGIEDMIGLFINTIPLRIQSAPNTKVIDIISEVEYVLQIREAFENTPLTDIGDYSLLRRGSSLFDTIVVMENYPLDHYLHPEGEGCILSVNSYSMVEITHYDLSIGIVPFNDIEINFNFKQDCFDKDTVVNLAGHFKRIIQYILENPETGLSQLDILSCEEKSQILFDFNNTAAEYPTNKTIQQLFEEQVKKAPDRISLVGAGSQTRPMALTYRQLNEQSNQLAALLIENGVLADNIVGIKAERSLEMIIGIMGILRAGGAYLPIDPEYPKERIDYMLKDSNARILLRMEECQEEIIVNCKLKNLPKAPPHHSSLILNGRPRRGLHHSNQLAYLIYTSGSTGKPKGVMIENRSVINFIKGITDIIPFQASDRILSLTTISFDIFGLETIVPLTKGSTIIIGTVEEQQDAGLGALIMAREAITIFQATPSRLQLFMQAPGPGGILKKLKYLLVGGEAFPEVLFLKLKQLTDGSIYNVYGPTETTIWSSIKKVSGDNTLNIGKPLVNTFIYILNRDRKLQPVDVAGEICISGEGVSRGYINRPELTAEKFPVNPFINGARLYCTGDIGRWLPDGNIECLGRIDQQVKLRGFRIELGEIENFLLKHDEIKDVVVVLKGDESHDQNLAAYFVSGIELSGAELREYLLKNLPGNMIPLYFIQLEKIPLTPSGKVDRRALPEPGITLEENLVMPGNEIESKLAIIWSEVLGIDQNKIGIESNFFHMGGHSLKITRLASLINRELDLTISLSQLFKLPTIRLQAGYLQEMKQPQRQKMENIPLQPLRPAPIQQYYDLSYAQRRLWIVCQFEEDSIAYNEVGGLTITGKFNPAAFDRAIQTLAQRHESLRTVFVVVNGEPKQKILQQVDLKLQQEDLRHLKGERLETEATKIIKNTANKAFNLEKGPLAAFKLLHLEDEKYFLLANIHHIINDGWSIGVIKNELNTLYDFHNKNRSADDTIPLPPVKFQYKDYTMWHNQLIADGYFDKIKEYWLEKFKDKPTGIELPLDHPRGTVQTFNGGRVYYRIEEKDVLALRKTCERTEENATLFMKLMTLLSILLHKYSGENDIIIGSPIAGRKQPELHRIIGFLVNTLAYRMQVEPTESFRQLLLNVKKETLTCYENQDYPFDILVEILGLARDLSRSPLFNVMMAFGDADTSGEDMRFECTDVEFHSQIEGFNPSLFDLVFFIDERGKHLDCEIMYNSDLYERSTIQRMAANFLTLLKNLLENSDKPIFDLEYIEKEEYQTIIQQFNQNKQDFQPDTIQELVEKQVEKSPDRIAIISPEGWAITYDEINKRANQLAHYLRRSYGIGPGEIVGICIARSIEMIIAVLGVVKSGAGYLSFDPNYPRARVRHMIEDSRASRVIIDQSRPDLFDAEEAKENGQILLNIHKYWPRIRGESPQNLQIQNKLTDIVYVIYTSGSTGTPNGAMLSHAILSNLIQWQATCTEIDGSLRCLQFTSINFCVSFQEIFTTLCSGGEVHLIGDIERQDIDFLVEYLARRKIGNLYLPFSYLNFLFTYSNKTGPGDKSYKTSLKHIITAGEQLKITSGMKKFLDQNPSIKLHNHYGSSEMHVVTAYTLDAPGAAAEPVPPVGKPIANTWIYILDENEKPVPIGVWGELLVAGSHEVPGYIHNPILTDKKLVWNPTLSAISGRRLYRSGDVGRWLEDGNIELKGRKDFQVKIRGFRVEPSEIESKILTLDKVKDCVVVVNENSPDEKILVAYIVTDGLDVSEIKRYLGNYLPQYMIPKFMILK
ncbi:MAG: hypothetical protein QG657_4895, partial [Acidobacteriota bacterium]|nr:hypothetical protein [Acidobacteriota bacterium]